MEWFYADEGRSIGPVSEEEFQTLVAVGSIRAETLVWNEDLTDWLMLGRLAPELAGEAPANNTLACSECGRWYLPLELIHFRRNYICADCKSVFIQKLKEGLLLPGQAAFGGFWIRAGAKMIDWMILGAANMAISFISAFLLTADLELAVFIGSNILQLGLTAAYNTYLVGRYGATIGKMACRLKVVTADNEPVSYSRALGRYFAEILSGMILGLGYFMVALDPEKRSLHDRICNTWVIKT